MSLLLNVCGTVSKDVGSMANSINDSPLVILLALPITIVVLLCVACADCYNDKSKYTWYIRLFIGMLFIFEPPCLYTIYADGCDPTILNVIGMMIVGALLPIVFVLMLMHARHDI